MRIAFYAPLKAPDAPTPSGDRQIARLLAAALEAGGHEPRLISRFRSFEGAGDAARMTRLAGLGARLAARCIRRLRALPEDRRPEAMFTYHAYDKAPDWIGPAVAEALGIPYVICEASLNPARAAGALGLGFEATRHAVAAADAVVELNPADRRQVAAALSPGAEIVCLPPFLETAWLAQGGTGRPSIRAALAAQHGLDPAVPWLLSVAMMRPGDKLASYRLLGRSLARLTDRPWHLLVAGDGAARDAVTEALAPLGEDRVRLLGRVEGAALAALYHAADIFLWPAVNEALGMAILEAQAAGLPVVAGRSGAVDTIVADGVTGLLAPAGDPAAFAEAAGKLLDAPQQAAALGAAAADKVSREHSLGAAARVLDRALAGARHRVGARARLAQPQPESA